VASPAGSFPTPGPIALSRREAVDEAIASLRVDGMEPSPFGMAALESVAAGELSFDEAIARLVAHHTM
jgi:hypothetical protein